MGRPSLLARFRRKAEDPSEDSARATPPRRATPPPGVLRRERRALLRVREERIRDLGGLMLEMYRRDRFREDLLHERCAELVSLEARLEELDSLLAAARQRLPAARCLCGAPILWGSHFCPNCGRPAGGAAVVACAHCGRPLPADARFCGSCGVPSLAEETGAADVGAAPPESEPRPDAVAQLQPAPDPWER